MLENLRHALLPSLLLLAGAPRAQDVSGGSAVLEDPISALLAEQGEGVRAFNDHVIFLASPFLEGRLPGTRGMEIAMDYVQHHFEQAGLEPAFDNSAEPEADGSPRSGYRDPFELGAEVDVLAERVEGAGGPFHAGADFAAMRLGGSGEASGEVVFVGYSVERGPSGDYGTYADGDDLTGKVAFMYRFEPMDEAGKSRWAESGPWGTRASFARKLAAVARRNPAAVILCNTPGADDPRNARLDDAASSTSQVIDVPVVLMSVEAGARLLGAAGRDPLAMRHAADEAGGIEPLGVEVGITTRLERRTMIAENVGGLLRGRGPLEEELIVIGAHLDHLGMGYFGSRSGPGELHPGADDNASGSAAVIMLARELSGWYAERPDGSSLRSILFLCFSGEESGLNGSMHYVDDPIRPLDRHALMINFDMIGRVTGGRLTVAGTDSAEGMREWLQPILEASPFVVAEDLGMFGGSDHAAFAQRNVPFLFSINDLHDDYHTPRDTSDRINRVGGAQVISMYAEIAKAAASWERPFVFQGGGGPAIAGTGPADLKVRFGIAPKSYDPSEAGVAVDRVTAGSSAEEAGIAAGDRLVTWNGGKIGDVVAWMQMLAECEPGQVVTVGVERGSELLEVKVTLKAK